jgi:hypothetical protein
LDRERVLVGIIRKKIFEEMNRATDFETKKMLENGLRCSTYEDFHDFAKENLVDYEPVEENDLYGEELQELG